MLHLGRPAGRLFFCLLFLAVLLISRSALADDPAKTIIADTIYRADGSAASGTLLISWPAFVTADSKPVAAGSLKVNIGPGGAINLPLVPTQGATPAGCYYKVVLKLDDGATSTEYWSVPMLSPTTIAAIRSSVVPSSVAMQVVSREYVDAADNASVHKNGDETIAGVKTFTTAPLVPDPIAAEAAANKGYVDNAVGGGGAGVLTLDKGGTGTSTWTAARCVRVADDGTMLESAAGDCGFGFRMAQASTLVADISAACNGADPGVVILPFGTSTLSAASSLPSNCTIQGRGRDKSTLLFSVPSGGTDDCLLIISKTNVNLRDLTIAGDTVTNPTSCARVVNIVSSSDVWLEHVKVSGARKTPPAGAMAGIIISSGSSYVHIEDSEVTDNGTATTQADYDVAMWDAPSDHVYFRRNRLHDSHSQISFAGFDVSDSEITDNTIDQNNTMRNPATPGGYGIMLYHGSSYPTRNVVSRNVVKNCAGNCFYFAGDRDSTITDNQGHNCVQQMVSGSLPLGCFAFNSTTRATVSNNLANTSTQEGFSFANVGDMQASALVAKAASGTGVKVYGTCTNTTFNGISVDGAWIGLWEPTGSTTDRCNLGNVQVDNTTAQAIALGDFNNSSLIGGSVKNFVGTGVLVQGGSGYRVSGITAVGAGYDFEVAGSNAQVDHNIGVNGTNALWNSAGTGITFSDNVIVSASSTGINTSLGTNSRVINNTIVSTPTPLSLAAGDEAWGNGDTATQGTFRVNALVANAAVTAPNFISNVATGTQPYATASDTLNTNLNADMLDSKHAGDLPGPGACNNQFVRATNSGAAPTCASVTTGDISDAAVTTSKVSIASRTHSLSFNIENPGSSDVVLLLDPGQNITITRLHCSVKAATNAAIRLYKTTEGDLYNTGGGTAAHASDLTCVTGGANTSTFSSAAVSAHTPVVLKINVVSGSPGWVSGSVEYTLDAAQ